MATMFEVQEAYTIAALRQLLSENEKSSDYRLSLAELFHSAKHIDGSLDLYFVLAKTAFAKHVHSYEELVCNFTIDQAMMADGFGGFTDDEYRDMWEILYDAIAAHTHCLNEYFVWNGDDGHWVTFRKDTGTWWVQTLEGDTGDEIWVFELTVPD